MGPVPLLLRTLRELSRLAKGYEVYRIVRLPVPSTRVESQQSCQTKFCASVRGPLQGVHGIILRKEQRHRLVIGVRLIQQAAAVEIDVNDAVPA